MVNIYPLLIDIHKYAMVIPSIVKLFEGAVVNLRVLPHQFSFLDKLIVENARKSTREKNLFFKHVLPRGNFFLFSAPLNLLDLGYRVVALPIKIGGVAFKYSVGLFKWNGKRIGSNIPKEFNGKDILWHAAKVALFILATPFCILVGVVAPKAAVWGLEKLHISQKPEPQKAIKKKPPSSPNKANPEQQPKTENPTEIPSKQDDTSNSTATKNLSPGKPVAPSPIHKPTPKVLHEAPQEESNKDNSTATKNLSPGKPVASSSSHSPKPNVPPEKTRKQKGDDNPKMSTMDILTKLASSPTSLESKNHRNRSTAFWFCARSIKLMKVIMDRIENGERSEEAIFRTSGNETSIGEIVKKLKTKNLGGIDNKLESYNIDNLAKAFSRFTQSNTTTKEIQKIFGPLYRLKLDEKEKSVKAYRNVLSSVKPYQKEFLATLCLLLLKAHQNDEEWKKQEISIMLRTLGTTFSGVIDPPLPEKPTMGDMSKYAHGSLNLKFLVENAGEIFTPS